MHTHQHITAVAESQAPPRHATSGSPGHDIVTRRDRERERERKIQSEAETKTEREKERVR